MKNYQQTTCDIMTYEVMAHNLHSNIYTGYMINRKGKSWVEYLKTVIRLLQCKRLIEVDGFYILLTSCNVIIQYDPWLNTISLLSDLDNPDRTNTFEASSKEGRQVMRDLALWQVLYNKGYTENGYKVILPTHGG